jgi:hypothetical protein
LKMGECIHYIFINYGCKWNSCISPLPA